MGLPTGREAIRGSAALLLLLLSGTGARPAPADAVEGRPTFVALPTDFVENRGQWSGSARFVARRGPLLAAFYPDSLRIHQGGDPLVGLRFEGASKNAALVGDGRRSGEYNFFFGNDPGRWRSRVPAWAGVLYRGLYPGVDVRVREGFGRIEYDVMLAPGADLSRVVIRAENACGLELEPDGSLMLRTAAGTLRQTPPRTWEVLGDGRKRPIASQFRVIDEERYGFAVPARDESLALVVDPGLEWSTFLGGSDREEIHGLAIATDGSGDVIVAGSTWSADFPATSGSRGVSPLVPFVARLTSNGSALVYATLFGGTDGNVSFGLGLALDSSSAPVVVGETNSATFPTTPGAFQPNFNEPSATINRGWDAFITRFDATGSQMVFSTFLGAPPTFDPGQVGSKRGGDESAQAVAVDATGAVIVSGATDSDDFPTTANAYDRTHEYLEVPVSVGGNEGVAIAATDSFIARLDPTGSQLTYSTFLGGQADDAVRDLVIDSQGFVTVVGVQAPIETFDAAGNRTDHGTPFPTTADAFARTHLGASDVFVARLKLDGAGAADLKYSTILGAFYIDEATSVALDPNNPELVTLSGHTRSWDFPTTPGAWRRAALFLADGTPYYSGFLARFRFPATGGGSLVWSTLLTGTGTGQFADSVVVDPSGDVIVVGSDIAGSYPTTERSYKRLPPKGSFVSRFSGDGKTLLHSTLLHQPSGVLVLRMQASSSGPHAVIVAGSTLLPDHPTTPGAFDRVFGSNGTGDGFHTYDGFMSKLTLDPQPSTDTTAAAPTLVGPPDGAAVPVGGDVTFDWADVVDPSGIPAYELAVSSNPDFLAGFGFFFLPNGGFVTTSQLTFPASNSGVYYWRVRALDGVNNFSPWSATRKILVGDTSWTNFAAVSLTPNAIVSGSTAQGKIFVQNFAPAGGIVYTLTSSNPAAATVPASVTVPAGANSATFTVTAKSVSKSTPVQLTVWAEGNGDHPVLWVDPVTPGAVAISSLTLSPTTVVGGGSSQGTVGLTAPASAGGAVVSLSSSNTAVATVPASVTVAAGATSATFSVTTKAVSSSTSVTITGSAGGASRSATLTVTPSLAGFRGPTANAADSGGDGNGFESGAASAHTDDAANALDNNSGTASTTSCTSTSRDRHRFFNYGLVVPAGANVRGIEVRLDARADSTSGAPKMCVQLSWDGGATWTAAKSTPTQTASMASYVLGGSADTWGRAWTSSQLSNASFRVRVANVASSTARDFFLDWIGVRVTTGAATPDTTPPAVSVTAPAGGATVSGTTTISANASDNVGVARVEFLVDGALLSTDTTSPYSASWNTTTATNGSHSLAARAFDAAGNQRTSAAVGVAVNNAPPPPDTTPPAVSVTAPAAGATVSGTTTMSANASDNVGVARVEFLVDGALLSTDTTSPYSASWNTTTATNGAHSLAARAFDAAGNQATSPSVGVTVSNGTPAVLDLTLSGVPSSIRRGQFFTATGTVANTGGTAASGYTVLVSFTPTDSMRLESPQSSTQSVATVAAGGTQSVSWQIRADRTASATLTMTLRNSSGATVDTASRALTITD